MYKGITLNQFIRELQRLAVEHGNDEISSIGSSSGKIAGMSSPFCFNFKGHDATEFVPAYQQDVKAAPVMESVGGEQVGDLRHVWARVGMTLEITPDEEKAIFEGDFLEGKAAVKQVVMDGRASLDGETYIPEGCIESFDEEYGTNYRNRDEECAWSLDGEYVNVARDEADAIYMSVIRELIRSGKADEILNSPKAQAYMKNQERLKDGLQMSPESLAKWVNAVLNMDVSSDAKKELFVGSFKVGQEYFERADGRSLRLTEKLENDFWKFDVYDRNGQWMHSTNAFAPRLALDILNGEIIPAAMAREKSVDGLISEAVDVAKQSNRDIGCVQQDFSK